MSAIIVHSLHAANMGSEKKLHGALSIVCDLQLGSSSERLILDAGNVDASVIGEVKEDIVGIDSLRSLLLSKSAKGMERKMSTLIERKPSMVTSCRCQLTFRK